MHIIAPSCRTVLDVTTTYLYLLLFTRVDKIGDEMLQIYITLSVAAELDMDKGNCYITSVISESHLSFRIQNKLGQRPNPNLIFTFLIFQIPSCYTYKHEKTCNASTALVGEDIETCPRFYFVLSCSLSLIRFPISVCLGKGKYKKWGKPSQYKKQFLWLRSQLGVLGVHFANIKYLLFVLSDCLGRLPSWHFN